VRHAEACDITYDNEGACLNPPLLWVEVLNSEVVSVGNSLHSVRMSIPPCKRVDELVGVKRELDSVGHWDFENMEHGIEVVADPR
jgi:hypothetical protein